MTEQQTEFGSLDDYRKGGIDIVNDDPKNYVFSNMFEVAANADPYERVCVAKNFEYAIEVARADGVSDWFSAVHDEFVLCMSGRVEVELVKLDTPEASIDPKADGAQRLSALPDQHMAMGHIRLGRGHMALLPVGAAYRLKGEEGGVVLFQTVQGPETVEKWAEICVS